MKTRTKPVKYAILHHQGGWEVKDRKALHALSLAEGYSDIPYSAYIKADGTVIQGRPDSFTNAANLGLNEEAISLCLAGNFDAGDNPHGDKGLMVPTDAQLLAGGLWLRAMLKKYPGLKWMEHRDVVKVQPYATAANGRRYSTATACPGSRANDMGAARIIWLIAGGLSTAAAKAKAASEGFKVPGFQTGRVDVVRAEVGTVHPKQPLADDKDTPADDAKEAPKDTAPKAASKPKK